MFEATIIIGSMLFSSPSARSFGFTALGLTVAIHLGSLLVGDLIDRKRGRIILLAALLSIVLLTLAALGVLALYNHGLHGVACESGRQEEVWILQKLCQL
jgi:MFS family permease